MSKYRLIREALVARFDSLAEIATMGYNESPEVRINLLQEQITCLAGALSLTLKELSKEDENE